MISETERSEAIDLERGKYLYTKGDLPREGTLFVVKSGLIALQAETGGRVFNVDVITPGQKFGYDGLLEKEEVFSAKVLHDSIVIPIPVDEAGLAAEFTEVIKRREEAIIVYRGNVFMRVAYALSKLAVHNNVAVSGTTIGKTAGISRESTSRVMTRFRVKEIIGSRTTDGVRIVNTSELNNRAGIKR